MSSGRNTNGWTGNSALVQGTTQGGSRIYRNDRFYLLEGRIGIQDPVPRPAVPQRTVGFGRGAVQDCLQICRWKRTRFPRGLAPQGGDDAGRQRAGRRGPAVGGEGIAGLTELA